MRLATTAAAEHPHRADFDKAGEKSFYSQVAFISRYTAHGSFPFRSSRREFMEFHENILGLIGNTPLVRLNRLTQGIRATVLAKMENLNPGYSVKDRIGISMIEAAEREGKLKPGGTHIMLTGLGQRLRPGESIGLTLAFARSGKRSLPIRVVPAGDDGRSHGMSH